MLEVPITEQAGVVVWHLHGLPAAEPVASAEWLKNGLTPGVLGGLSGFLIGLGHRLSMPGPPCLPALVRRPSSGLALASCGAQTPCSGRSCRTRTRHAAPLVK